MGIINIGTSSHVFSWKMPLTSQGLNQLTYRITPAGIYDGFAVTKLSDNQVSVAPGTCVIDDDTSKVSVKVKTETAILLSVSSIDYFLILRMVWTNAENYMDALSVEPSEVLATDVVIGKLIYSGATLNSIDYSYRSFGNLKDEKVFLDPQLTVLWIGTGTNFWFINGWTIKYLNERTKSTYLTSSVTGTYYLAYDGSAYVAEADSTVVAFDPTKNGFYDAAGNKVLALFNYSSITGETEVIEVYGNTIPAVNNFKKYLDAALKQKMAYSSGSLSTVTYYNHATTESLATTIAIETFTYTSGALTSSTLALYIPAGTLFKTYTYTYSYSSGSLSTVTYTIS